MGVVIGLAAAAMSTRGLAFYLVGVDPLDLPVFGTVAVLLIMTGIAASYLPARRATRVDPMLALRPD